MPNSGDWDMIEMRTVEIVSFINAFHIEKCRIKLLQNLISVILYVFKSLSFNRK